MFEGKRIGCVFLMGGEGRRFGRGMPKQFHLLGDKKVFCHALKTLQRIGIFDEMIVVCHRDWMAAVEGAKVVEGGRTRQESCYSGLKAFEKRPEIVLVHDAVRPFVSERIVRENVAGAILWGAIDTCIPSADTLVHAPGGQVIASIPKREEFLRGQTPQTFRMDWLLEAHEKALEEGIENASDDCLLVARLGKEIHVVKGEERNMKITSEWDLLIAEQQLLALDGLLGRNA